MSFYQCLQDATSTERQALVNAEIINRSLQGDIDLQDYVNFLQQAYHHVKHTVPLLMAVGARLPEEKEWLRTAVAHYIEEEVGHQEWILNDIAACGYDKETVRHSKPNFATELMVSYAYDLVNRVNPIGFFGMVLVLEGTSVSLADLAANRIRDVLQLPERAFSYLRSHGSIDQSHIKYLEDIINRFENPDEQALVSHAAKTFYQLYKGIFDSLQQVTTESGARYALAQ